MKPIILASTSPRRKELMQKLGLEFEIVASDYEEDMSLELEPLELAKMLSLGKAESVAKQFSNHIIIAADTFIALENELLGKPHTKDRAIEMLKKISGRPISVITGVTIIDTASNKKFPKLSRQKFISKICPTEKSSPMSKRASRWIVPEPLASRVWIDNSRKNRRRFF